MNHTGINVTEAGAVNFAKNHLANAHQELAKAVRQLALAAEQDGGETYNFERIQLLASMGSGLAEMIEDMGMQLEAETCDCAVCVQRRLEAEN